MKKPTLCVIFGGKSAEHYVSLRSAFGVLTHLDLEKYSLVRLGVTKEGKWYIFEGKNEEILKDTWENGKVRAVTLDLSSGELIELQGGGRIKIDVFLPIMHGEYVEDGRLQGLFDICGARYVGCGAFASHICMDKELTKNVARSIGIPVAKGVVVNAKCKVQNAKLNSLSHASVTAPHKARLCKHASGKEPKNAKCMGVGTEIKYPVFVKPCMCGSSVGVSRVENEGELKGSIEEAAKHCDRVLIEEAIEGCEVEIALMERGQMLLASPVGMIRHGGKFYGYEEKYESRENEYIIPAPIEEKSAKYIEECAKKLFLEIGCRALSRFDFFIKKNGEVVFNEVNTMPGFTEISMFPKLFMHTGITYSEIIDNLIEGI